MTEPQGLLLPSGEPFATGASTYFDSRPNVLEPLPRIYVKFTPSGTDLTFLALLDTGGHYVILSDSVVQEIGEQLTERMGRTELRTAHGTVRGDLYLHRITLVAETGTSLDFDAAVFVSPEWRGGNFIGYAGALDRVCFAANPLDNNFYFGPLR